jgi:hypothetical protein
VRKSAPMLLRGWPADPGMARSIVAMQLTQSSVPRIRGDGPQRLSDHRVVRPMHPLIRKGDGPDNIPIRAIPELMHPLIRKGDGPASHLLMLYALVALVPFHANPSIMH